MMAESKFDNVWRLLSKYPYRMDNASVNADLMCKLCKNLMIDACQTTCNCQYCHKCISDYLEKGNMFCPGGEKECAETQLVLQRDVLRNIRTNNKIAKMKMKCPMEACDIYLELTEMEEHLQSRCVYSVLGCGDEELQIDEDLNSNVIFKWMRNFNKQISTLKEMCEANKTEISSLTKELDRKERVIQEITKEMVDQREEVKLLKEESKEKTVKIESLRQSLLTNGANGKLVGGSAIKEPRKMDGDDVQMEEIKQSLMKIRAEMKRCDDEIERKLNNVVRWNRLCPNMDVDFMWKIDKYSKKKGTLKGINSAAFYSHGYKMCLRVYFDRDSFHLWSVLMLGERDQHLEWPMKHPVTLSIINQETMKRYKSLTFAYKTCQKDKRAFHRSVTATNSWYIGSGTFLHYDDIASLPMLGLDDCIMLSCLLEDL